MQEAVDETEKAPPFPFLGVVNNYEIILGGPERLSPPCTSVITWFQGGGGSFSIQPLYRALNGGFGKKIKYISF